MADQQQAVGNEEETIRLVVQYSGKGDLEKLRSILEERKVDVNVYRFGWTGLLCASRKGHVECVKLLLDSKANTDLQNQEGMTGLMFASVYGHTECVKLLLDSKANIELQDVEGQTGLMIASMYGHAQCVKLFLYHKASVDRQTQDGSTAVILASGYGRAQCAKLLLESGADVNIANFDGSTALSNVCRHNLFISNKPLLQFLLLSCGAEGEEGKEVLDEMKTSITTYHTELKKVLSEEVIVDTRLYVEEHGLYHEPLERVVQYCGLELMLDNDPNRNEDDPIPQLLRDGPERVRSAWYWGEQFAEVLAEYVEEQANEAERVKLVVQYSENGDLEKLRSILEERKVDVNAQNRFGWTGLLCASQKGHVECVKLLLDSKANIDLPTQDGMGRTGLMFASVYGHTECVKLLLDSKANTDLQNQEGMTGLMFASIYGHTECVKLLLDSKANIELQDVEGQTGLMIASMYGHAQCVKLFLYHKASVDRQTQDGSTSVILASGYGRAQCAKLLLESGADVNIATFNGSTALSNVCRHNLFISNKPLLQFLLLSCGAEGEEGKEVLDEMKTSITTYHTELKKVLSEEAIVDTRLYVEEHGLYHEPLERVMQYCGLELMLDNDPNRNEDDPIPQLLRDGPERVRSAWYWGEQFAEVLAEYVEGVSRGV